MIFAMKIPLFPCYSRPRTTVNLKLTSIPHARYMREGISSQHSNVAIGLFFRQKGVPMIRPIKNPGRRKFLREVTLAGAALAASPLAKPTALFAQAANRSRVVIAHGVGVYSLNPYAVNTSPLVAAWGSIMEPLIDADYEKRGYRGVLAESWQMTGTKLQFKLRKGIRFHDGTPLTSRDVIASFKRILTDKASLQAPNLENVKEMDAAR